MTKTLLCNSLFFGVVISILGYEIGVLLKRKLKWSIVNPLLISIIFVMLSLSMLKVDYDNYYDGAKYLSYLLTPATVCLAIPLYEQLELLKNNWKAIFIGITSGVISSLVSVLLLCILFQFNHSQYVTLLPKSITTAIGMGISEELGGIVSITTAVIVVTGVFGNITSDIVFRIFSIKHPIAKGLALGTSSHALGTMKAMELGAIEGAMSSLSIVVSGLLTVIGASIFAGFL